MQNNKPLIVLTETEVPNVYADNVNKLYISIAGVIGNLALYSNDLFLQSQQKEDEEERKAALISAVALKEYAQQLQGLIDNLGGTQPEEVKKTEES